MIHNQQSEKPEPITPEMARYMREIADMERKRYIDSNWTRTRNKRHLDCDTIEEAQGE